jgi:hypothetical protein
MRHKNRKGSEKTTSQKDKTRMEQHGCEMSALRTRHGLIIKGGA